MRSLFIIDDWARIKPTKDTSLDLMRIANSRAHDVFIARDVDVFWREGDLLVDASLIDYAGHHPINTADFYGETNLFLPTEELIKDFNAVFIRKDPPFDATYMSLALMLSLVEKAGPVFVNSPKALLHISEKLSALNFPSFLPDTLVSASMKHIGAFIEKYERVVVKPPFDGSGRGVFSTAKDEDWQLRLTDAIAQQPGVPLIVQGFLPEVGDGDVRVMLIDGEVVGAIGRVPGPDDFRANIAAGGKEVRVDPTATQQQMAQEVGQMLADNGVIYAGLDFIGNHLIEINVTSPTLVQELRKVADLDVGEMIWDAVEAHARASDS